MAAKSEWIEGIITPSIWDRQGNVLEVHIALNGEVNVQLESNHKSSELSKFTGAVVRLLGLTAASKFIVEDYKILKHFKGENHGET